MKTIYLIIGVLLMQVNLYAQSSSNETKVILLVTNEKNEPVRDELMLIESDKLTESITEVTDANGKVKIVLPKGGDYMISFENAVNHTKFTIDKNSRSLITKRLVLQPTQITKSEKTTETVIEGDTIHFNLDKTAQSYERKLLATVIFYTRQKQPIPNLNIWIIDKKRKKVYHAITDEKGAARFHLPRNQTFQINLKDAPNYQQLNMPDIPNIAKRVRYVYSNQALNINETEKNDTVYQVVPLTQKPTFQRVWLHVIVNDLDRMPLKNEKVFMNGKKGKTYAATTNEEGIALLMIPKGDTFSISFEYEPNIEAIHYPNGNYLRKDNIIYSYIGSAIIKAREAERLAALRDRDSLYRIGELGYGITQGLDIRNLDRVEKLVAERAVYEKGELEKDPTFFIKREQEVKAVLYRNLADWKNKIIVTDATGSMSPYWDQVVIWHALHMIADEKNAYIFFNDGDRKARKDKLIGSTGGIYQTEESNLKAILNAMREATSNGSGGEQEENDIEALLKGLALRKNEEELVLIADNYSDVRDMELLTKLNVPVRIVLAGVRKGLGVHEDYLELAYKTGGSIHTLEQDVFNLKNMLDGQSIIIGKYEYRVMRGKFIQVSKL